MRVALITPWAGSAYGTEQSLNTSRRLLEEAGHTCEIFTGEWTGVTPPPAGVHVLTHLNKPRTLPNPSPFSVAANQLMAALKQYRPDIVHFHETLPPSLLSRIGRSFPSLFTAHSVAMTCPASHRTPAEGPVCTLKSGWSCLVHNRNLRCLDDFRRMPARVLVVAHHLAKEGILKKYFHVVAVSHYLKDVFTQAGWSTDRIHVVYNAVEVSPLQRTPDAAPPLLLVASRLKKFKGTEWLLRGLALITKTEWRCYIAGKGEELSDLEKLTRELGLADRVEFLGYVPAPTLKKLYARAAVVVQTNIGPEGFGLSIAEASAAAVPVVASDVPPLNEIIRAEETGLLVNSRSPEAIARAIERLLSDPSLAKQLGENGRKRITHVFSPQSHLEGLLKAYNTVLESRR